MIKLLLYIVLTNTLFALDVNEKIPFNELLSHAQIYIDHNKSVKINTVDEKKFKPNNKNLLSFGYSPDFDVWIKFTLTNSSQKTIRKIIEYDNPLTSYVTFYETNIKEALLKDGLLATVKERASINPILHITLHPNESKIFYIKVYSNITPLIIKLNLWNNDAFYKKELRNQFILALFFGAMGLIIIYNFIIYLSTRQKSYFYYVLSFIGILIYYLLYKGVANLYILSPEHMVNIIKFSSFIVAIPVFFLALFTKNILDLKQYPRIYRILHYYLIAFPLLILFVYVYDLNQYRSFFPVLLLFMLVCITFYVLIKNNRQAKFIMLAWLVFFTSGLFMFLSSSGIYNIFSIYPYYSEFSLIAEAVAFSFSLADKLKQLHQERLAIQNNFIAYQEEETNRLTKMVEDKTSDLKKSLNEKKLLLKELNHRIKNSMQTIISFLRLQKDDTLHKETQDVLQNVENKVFAINDLYALLHTTENISTVNAYTYFSQLINNVKKSFQKPYITLNLITEEELKSDDAVYCGFILNEALTNSYQHAFTHQQKGEILISLHKRDDIYHFLIQDNGIGYTAKNTKGTLGMIIIETLAEIQLDGKISIDSSNGVKIHILWSNSG